MSGSKKAMRAKHPDTGARAKVNEQIRRKAEERKKNAATEERKKKSAAVGQS